MKGTFLHMLLNRIATMITSIFQNNNDADSFVSRFKDSYNQKTTMNTTSETPGYLIPQTISQKRESLNNNIPVAHFAAFDLLTLKHGVMKKWILKSAVIAMVLLIINLLFAQMTFAQTTITISTGTTTWTCPAGVFSVSAECYAGGAAGGGATGNPAAGGGGGGGGYVKNTTIAVVPGTTYNVSVAATATGTTGAGANGTDTWFISAATLLAKGGLGGGLASANSQTAAGGLAVTTGNVGATAPFSYYGGAGGTGTASGAAGGGGGSSAGTGVNGNAPVGLTGGVAPTGGFAGATGSSSSADGANNTNIGGGGAGAHAGSATDRLGGNGGPGQIKLTYTTPLTYKSQLVSMSLGSTTWCAGETRNVSIQIKNIGTATWNDVTGQDINVGIKWNTNGANWTDYHVRVDAAGLAPGATGTYNFTITASNATAGPVYGTVLTAGTNNLIFDVVYEGVSWFGDNGNGVGPGNVKFTSPNQTIVAVPTITKGANPTVCQLITAANLSYSATTGTPTLYSIDYDAAANLAGFVDVTNAALPATPIVMVVPAAVAAGTYNGSLTVKNAGGCSSSSQAISVTVTAAPTVTPGTSPTVCRGTTSALLSYSSTNSPNQYSIDYDATANLAGFTDVSNAALPGSNISLVIPAAATAAVYNGILTVRNSVTGCVSANSAITVTVLAPAVSFTGSTSVCVGGTSTLSPTTGGTWISNSPAVATVDNSGNITSVGAGSATFTFTETATGCSNTTGGLTVNTNSSVSLLSAVGTDALVILPAPW